MKKVRPLSHDSPESNWVIAEEKGDLISVKNLNEKKRPLSHDSRRIKLGHCWRKVEFEKFKTWEAEREPTFEILGWRARFHVKNATKIWADNDAEIESFQGPLEPKDSRRKDREIWQKKWKL